MEHSYLMNAILRTMNRIPGRFMSIAFYSDLHGIRFILGFAELLWAVTLLWPGDTFGRPTYTVMSHVMGEESWGLVFLLSCTLQYYILYSGEYHSRFATYFACWNMSLWLYVVISMYMSVTPAAISGEAALCLAAGWVWVRSGYVIEGRRSTDYGGKPDRRDPYVR